MCSRPAYQRGVTLIELIVTISIVGILLAIATPSFKTLLRNRELKSASESIHQGLQLARSEAVRRNVRVRFVIASDTGWTVSDDSGTSIQSKPAKEGAPTATISFTPSASRRVTFNSFGRVTANADASAALTRIDFTATGATVKRRINIDAGGRINLCDPDTVATTDSYYCG